MTLSPLTPVRHHGRTLRFGSDDKISPNALEAEFNRRFPDTPSPSYLPSLGKLVDQVQFCLEADYHRHGLTTLNYASKAGLLENRKNIALINVDSHSDLHRKDTESQKHNDANWVNGAVMNHPQISEVIWVIPRAIKQVYDQWEMKPGIPKPGAIGAFFDRATMYVDRQAAKISWDLPPMDWVDEPGKTDRVSLRVVTEDQLPDMLGRHVYLSLDMDYFCNNGHDTFKATRVAYRGEKAFCRLFQNLNRAGVSPFLMNTALSPDYSVMYREKGQKVTLEPLAAQFRKLTRTIWELAHRIPQAYPLDDILAEIEAEAANKTGVSPKG